MASRRGVLIAAILSTIQSLASITFGAFALISFACLITPTPPGNREPGPLSAFRSSFYHQYFHSQNNCIAHNVSFWNETRDFDRGWNMTRSWAVQGWFIGYVAENTLWFISSVLLFVGISMNNKRLFTSYSVVQGIVMLYDAVLIIIFAIDFESYSNYNGFEGYLRVTKTNMLIGIILMMLIFGRFIIFYILNIVFIYIAQSAARNVRKPTARRRGRRRAGSDMSNRALPPAPPAPHHPRQYPQEQQIAQDAYPSDNKYPGQPSMDQRSPPPDILINSPRRNFHLDGSGYGDPNGLPELYREPRPGSRMFGDEAEFHSRQRSFESLDPAQLHGRDGNGPRYPRENFDDGEFRVAFDPGAARKARPEPEMELAQYYQEPGRRDVTADVVRRRDRKPPPSRPGIRRDSSSASDVPELKNQRPWSYIRPEEIPSHPNKLNQIYNHLQSGNKLKQLAAVQQDDGEDSSSSDDRRPGKSVRYKGANLLYQSVPNIANQAIETDETTSSSTSYRPNESSDDRRPLLAGRQESRSKEKKNVRFNMRAQSMGFLDSSPHPDETRQSTRTRKSQKVPSGQSKLSRNQWSGSGDELCTDEFSFISYGSPAKNRPVVSMHANASPVIRRIEQKKKNADSASSPDLVYDPKTNTVRLTFNKPPPAKKATTCRNEGSMRIHDPSCNGRDCYRNERRYSQSYV